MSFISFKFCSVSPDSLGFYVKLPVLQGGKNERLGFIEIESGQKITDKQVRTLIKIFKFQNKNF